MKRTINFNDFLEEWNRWEDRKDQFSYQGKRSLFEYLEYYEEDTGEQIELDIVALCCEFTEYDSLEEFHKNYDRGDYFHWPSHFSTRDRIETIEEHAVVMPVLDNAGNKTGRFVIQDF